MRVDEVLADFDGYMSSADHVEFYWVPHTGWALTKRNRRTDEPAQPRGRAKEFLDDDILHQRGLRRHVPRRPPAAEPDPQAGQDPAVHGAGRVHRPQRPRVHQPAARALLRDGVRHPPRGDPRGAQSGAAARRRGGHPAQLPGGGAGGGARRHPASTAQGRPTGYIAVHVYQGTPYDAYFQGVEAIMDCYGGRPHWGKMHFQGPRPSRAATRAGTSSRRCARRLDPDGRFTNQYLERVLGPVVP